MHIPSENFQRLIRWLALELSGLSGADEDTLAEYVVALLKNDKENEALKSHCIKELKYFLADETEGFVSKLFSVISDGSYLQLPDDKEDDNDEEDDGGRIGFHRRGVTEDDGEDGDSRRRHGPKSRRAGYDSDEDDSLRKRKKTAIQDDTTVSDGSSTINGGSSIPEGRGGRGGDFRRREDFMSRGGADLRQLHGRGRSFNHGPFQPPVSSGYGYAGMMSSYFPPPVGHSFPLGPPHHQHHGPQMFFDGMSHQGNMGVGVDEMGFVPPGMQGHVIHPPPLRQLPQNNIRALTEGSRDISPGPMTTTQPPPPPGPAPPSSMFFSPLSNTIEDSSFDSSQVKQQQQIPQRPESGYPSIFQPNITGPLAATNNMMGMNPYFFNEGNPLGIVRPGISPGQQTSNRGGGQRHSQRQHLNHEPLPDSERCTLKCSGIPSRVTHGELMDHFRGFGRIVQLQLIPGIDAPPPGDVPDDSKKVYSECLVQFARAEDARRCFSSPAAVLNNRFIRLNHAHFNIISPNDVPPVSVDEEAREELIRRQLKQKRNASLATGTSDAASTVKVKAPIPSALMVGSKYVNMTYVAPASSASVTAEGVTAAGVEGEGDSSVITAEDSPTQPPSSAIGVGNANDVGKPTAGRSMLGSRSGGSEAAEREQQALAQRFEELKKLRSEEENIMKKKELLIQGQIDQCRKIIAKLESAASVVGSSNSEKRKKTLEDMEQKIIDLQTQMQQLRDNRDRSTNASASITGAASPILKMIGSSARRGGGYGALGAHFGRAGGRRAQGFRGRGGRGPYGRSHPAPSSSMIWRNPALGPAGMGESEPEKTRTLVVCEAPFAFEASAAEHFGRFGAVQSISSILSVDESATSSADGDRLLKADSSRLAIIFEQRSVAETALKEGAMYEGVPIVLDWLK